MDNSNILQIHHIIPRKRGGTDEEGNLRILCPNCHATEHYGDSRVKKEGTEVGSSNGLENRSDVITRQ